MIDPWEPNIQRALWTRGNIVCLPISFLHPSPTHWGSCCHPFVVVWAWLLSAFLPLSPHGGKGGPVIAIWSSSTCLPPMGPPNTGGTTDNHQGSLCLCLPLERPCLSFPLPSQEPGTGPGEAIWRTPVAHTPGMHVVLRILQVLWIPRAYTI